MSESNQHSELVAAALKQLEMVVKEMQREIEYLRQVCGITATDTSAGVLTLIRRAEAAELALKRQHEYADQSQEYIAQLERERDALQRVGKAARRVLRAFEQIARRFFGKSRRLPRERS